MWTIEWCKSVCMYILFHYTCSHTRDLPMKSWVSTLGYFSWSRWTKVMAGSWSSGTQNRSSNCRGKNIISVKWNYHAKSLMTLLSILQTLQGYQFTSNHWMSSEINLTQLLGILKMHFIVNILHFMQLYFECDVLSCILSQYLKVSMCTTLRQIS